MSSEEQNNQNGGLFYPLWLFVIVIAPQSLLLFVHYRHYQLVHSVLDDKARGYWWDFGLLALLLLVAFGGYGLLQLWRKRPVSRWLAMVLLVCYVPASYIWVHHWSAMFPSSVPQWMLDMDTVWQISGGFVMPTFLYAIAMAVSALTPRKELARSWINFAAALLIPTLWYVFFRLILPLWQMRTPTIQHTMLILFVISTLVFIFFALRWIVILMGSYVGRFAQVAWAAKILVTLVFPLLGLCVYNDLLGMSDIPKILGNLSHPLFYGLAVVTGLALLLPQVEYIWLRLLLWVWRLLCYPFTLYFFIIFLPWLPLSILAIIFVGLGFLMLAPIFLMYLHTSVMFEDWRALRLRMGIAPLLIIGLLSVAIMPGVIAVSMYRERVILHRAMDFVFQPNQRTEMDPRIDLRGLRYSLDMLKSSTLRHRRGIIYAKHIPLITTLYRSIVLDNMTLSPSRIRQMELIFWGQSTIPADNASTSRPVAAAISGQQTSDVVITSIKPLTVYNVQTGIYRSEIDLTLKYRGKFGLAEYHSSFELPQGAWISDYYLWIEDKKVRGMLTEKKATLWVYQQILRERRDPGLVYYERNNRIHVRVFPFQAKETRRTGFTLLHREPLRLQIDGHTVPLTSPIAPPSPAITSLIHTTKGSALYLSQAAIAKLPEIQRTVYFHFVLDMSQSAASNRAQYINRIEQFLQRYPQMREHSRISLVNFRARSYLWHDAWREAIASFPSEGGFFLERAIQIISLQHFMAASRAFPVIVVLSPSLPQNIHSNDLDALSFAFPESDLFYTLSADAVLQPVSLRQHIANDATSRPSASIAPNTAEQGSSSTQTATTITSPHLATVPRFIPPNFAEHKVVAWPNLSEPQAFVRITGGSSIVLLPKTTQHPKPEASDPTKIMHSAELLRQIAQHKPSTPAEEQLHEQMLWYAGLAIWSQWLNYVAAFDSPSSWVDIVKASWQTSLLTPLTTYTVLETEAQWETLRRKQAQVLAGKSYFDLESDQTRRMSEPPLWLMTIFLLALLWYMRKKLGVRS